MQCHNRSLSQPRLCYILPSLEIRRNIWLQPGHSATQIADANGITLGISKVIIPSQFLRKPQLVHTFLAFFNKVCKIIVAATPAAHGRGGYSPQQQRSLHVGVRGRVFRGPAPIIMSGLASNPGEVECTQNRIATRPSLSGDMSARIISHGRLKYSR